VDIPTTGVEEEFFLIDDTGKLMPRAPEALDDTDDTDADLKPELLRYQVESATKVCKTGHELVEELTGLRDRLATGAAQNGARMAASGTVVHAQSGDAQIGPGSRYRRIADQFGQLVVGGLVCGCHVHVGVPDRLTALKVSNHLRPWLPVFLAVSANSPYFDGKDTGYASSRHLLYSRWPSAGPPPYLESVDEYESIMEGLLSTGAALDRKMIYWDIRPSEHQPTVEVRVADVLGTAREAAFTALLIRMVATRALESTEDGVAAEKVPTEFIRAGLWRAAKDGITGSCPDPMTGQPRPVHAIIDELVATNTKQLKETEELELVASTMDRLRRRGGGADRQRRAYAANGQLDGVLQEITVRPS
jgi:carboxylate-amine ligase